MRFPIFPLVPRANNNIMCIIITSEVIIETTHGLLVFPVFVQHKRIFEINFARCRIRTYRTCEIYFKLFPPTHPQCTRLHVPKYS